MTIDNGLSAANSYSRLGFEKTLSEITQQRLAPEERSYQIALLIEQAVEDKTLFTSQGITPKDLFDCALEHLTQDDTYPELPSKIFSQIHDKARMYGDGETSRLSLEQINDLRTIENMLILLKRNHKTASPIFPVHSDRGTKNYPSLELLFEGEAKVSQLLSAGMSVGSSTSDTPKEMKDEYLAIVISKVINEKSLLALMQEDSGSKYNSEFDYLCQTITHMFRGDHLEISYSKLKTLLKDKLLKEMQASSGASIGAMIRCKDPLYLDVLSDLFVHNSETFKLDEFLEAFEVQEEDRAEFLMKIAIRTNGLGVEKFRDVFSAVKNEHATYAKERLLTQVGEFSKVLFSHFEKTVRKILDDDSSNSSERLLLLLQDMKDVLSFLKSEEKGLSKSEVSPQIVTAFKTNILEAEALIAETKDISIVILVESFEENFRFRISSEKHLLDSLQKKEKELKKEGFQKGEVDKFHDVFLMRFIAKESSDESSFHSLDELKQLSKKIKCKDTRAKCLSQLANSTLNIGFVSISEADL